jgi:CheY-like chemotaxis protein
MVITTVGAGLVFAGELERKIQSSYIRMLEQVRGDDETKNLKVVMTSGLNVEDECLESGANGFILKPYMPDDLLGILKKNIQPS